MQSAKLRSAPGPSRNTPRTVAVVGAGLAGLACADALREAGQRVWLFDKSRGPSGRAATRRGDDWSCDHGAQYFTADDPDFAAEVRRWCEAGVAAEWNPRLRVHGAAPVTTRRDQPTRRFVGVPAMTSPARWLASRQQLQLQHTIDALRREGDAWRLRSAEHGWLD
ncbi:MAG: NAD(P)-binding protein, partial [Betaproteobacteria bacterium]|nr:NAD(P)-binding protein [Betaproteobacteria bacterium]